MNFDKYKNKMMYPERVIKPKLPYNVESNVIRAYADELEQYELDIKKHKMKLKEYKQEDHRLLEHFKEDVLEEVGLSNHKNKDKIFSYAWDAGHSNGYHQVYCILSDLSKLFK